MTERTTLNAGGMYGPTFPTRPPHIVQSLGHTPGGQGQVPFLVQEGCLRIHHFSLHSFIKQGFHQCTVYHKILLVERTVLEKETGRGLHTISTSR